MNVSSSARRAGRTTGAKHLRRSDERDRQDGRVGSDPVFLIEEQTRRAARQSSQRHRLRRSVWRRRRNRAPDPEEECEPASERDRDWRETRRHGSQIPPAAEQQHDRHRGGHRRVFRAEPRKRADRQRLAAASRPAIVDSGRQATATITASAAGISGYTVNELKRYGPVSAAAAHPNVAADVEPVIARAHCHSRVAASAAIRISIATTP